MAKADTYIKSIRLQVKADHNGVVPAHLDLTIRNYASALETRDIYRDRIAEDGCVIIEVGSMGQQTTKQHPLCSLLYQQELLCLNYAKALGGTFTKAAAKVDSSDINTDNPMDKLAEALK